MGYRLAIQGGLVALALAAGLAPLPASGIERWFSTGVYPTIQRLLTPVSNAVPFALFDVFAVAACATLAAILIRATKTARQTRRAVPLVRAVGTLGVAAACVYLIFLLLWGFNYRRVPMAARLAVESGVPAAETVTALGVQAAAELNSLYEPAHQAGWQASPLDDQRLTRAFADVQRALSDAPAATPGRLKSTLFGPYFRWTGVDGMINPFGLEVLTNPDLLPFERPFIAAHEWAHLAGYADEAEASFVGWLACMQADVPARYSGWLFLYWQVSGEVDATGRTQMAEALGEGPRQDIDAIIERLRSGQRPWLRTAGWRIYDQYLKANRVEEGVRSYGAVVTLILQARFNPGWMPVRR
jgi:hypothetical protein